MLGTTGTRKKAVNALCKDGRAICCRQEKQLFRWAIHQACSNSNAARNLQVAIEVFRGGGRGWLRGRRGNKGTCRCRRGIQASSEKRQPATPLTLDILGCVERLYVRSKSLLNTVRQQDSPKTSGWIFGHSLDRPPELHTTLPSGVCASSLNSLRHLCAGACAHPPTAPSLDFSPAPNPCGGASSPGRTRPGV